MICWLSNRELKVGLAVSTMGTSALTTISSPKSGVIVISTDETAPMATRTSSADCVWKPGRLALTL